MRVVVDLSADEFGYVVALAAVRHTTPAALLRDGLHALPVGWTERREVNEFRLQARVLSPRARTPGRKVG